MERNFRYTIVFCVQLGEFATETMLLLQTAFGENCVSQSTFYHWFKGLKPSKMAE